MPAGIGVLLSCFTSFDDPVVELLAFAVHGFDDLFHSGQASSLS
jgi:hypothetical protein